MRITGYKRQIIVVLLFAIVGVSIFFFAWYIISSGRKRVGRTEEVFNQIPQSTPLTEGPGLGQCHWIGGPFNSNPGLRWAYSSSIPFFFTDAGDGWAGIEQTKGVYNFTQIENEINIAKSKEKHFWIQIQVADDTNKEHNVPKWAIDEGVETIPITECNSHARKSYVEWAWDDGTDYSIKALWDDPELPKYLDKTEAVLIDQNGNVTTDTSMAKSVRLPIRIAAIWDPTFREYYGNALMAMRAEFEADFESGVIQAVNLMSGGRYGESALNSECPGWNEWSGTCLPDERNPDCPVIKSMAKFVQKEHYPNLTAEQVATQIIAQKSNCNPANTIPGNTVELCTQEDHMNCATEYGSYCYVFDDYFIQAEKDLIRRYVAAFYPTPLVWQDGPGLSGTGRTNRVMILWMQSVYGNEIWLKANSWNPNGKFFWTQRFNRYNNVGAVGYEAGHPMFFKKQYYIENAQGWCDMYLDEECNGNSSCLPEECTSAVLDGEAIGRRAVVTAIRKGIVEERSSYLCLQSDFFDEEATDTDGDGLYENQYFFNPSDQSENCVSSEVNVEKYGYGFCPGYLNWTTKQNVPKPVNGQCVPNCTGKVCGSDGCGGSCGTCPSGQTCTSTGTCQAPCIPNCTGKACGDDDGCEDRCRTCPSEQTCNTSIWTCQSTCIPSCTGRTCGSDGCEGSCGSCTSLQICNASGVCTLRGDLNTDLRISISDYALFIIDYTASLNDHSVNPRSDFNIDSKISVSDYAIFIQAYLEYLKTVN